MARTCRRPNVPPTAPPPNINPSTDAPPVKYGPGRPRKKLTGNPGRPCKRAPPGWVNPPKQKKKSTRGSGGLGGRCPRCGYPDEDTRKRKSPECDENQGNDPSSLQPSSPKRRRGDDGGRPIPRPLRDLNRKERKELQTLWCKEHSRTYQRLTAIAESGETNAHDMEENFHEHVKPITRRKAAVIPSFNDIRADCLDHGLAVAAVASVYTKLHSLGIRYTTLDALGLEKLRGDQRAICPYKRIGGGTLTPNDGRDRDTTPENASPRRGRPKKGGDISDDDGLSSRSEDEDEVELVNNGNNNTITEMNTFILPLLITQRDRSWYEPYNDPTQIIPPTAARRAASARVHYNAKGGEQGLIGDGDGHILLAVATKIPQLPYQHRTRPNQSRRQTVKSQVEIRIYDSLPAYYSLGSVRWVIHETLRRSGWLDDIKNEKTCWLYESEAIAPKQRYLTNTCGLHTILNSWIVMLALKPKGTKNPSPTIQAYKRAVEMVNWALGGKVTFGEIRAFLICQGWAEVPEGGRRGTDGILVGVMDWEFDDERTFAMTDGLFSDFVEGAGIGVANEDQLDV